MPIPLAKLRVLPNPWTYIDHLGRPGGFLLLDHHEHAPHAKHGEEPDLVGAEIHRAELVKPAETLKIGGVEMETRAARHNRRFAYELAQPTELPNTGYYRQHVKAGDLIPYDDRTRAECGLPPGTKLGAAALTAAREAAIKAFDAETDEDAWKRMGAHEPLQIGKADEQIEAARVAAAAAEQADVPSTAHPAPAAASSDEPPAPSRKGSAK